MSSATHASFAHHSWRNKRDARTLRAYMALHNQDIAERLRELRGNRPQTLVAAEMGVSARALQNWEAAEARPSYRNVEKLAAFYDVPEEFILTGGRRSLSRVPEADGERPAPPEPTVPERLGRIEAALELAASERQQIVALLAQQTALLAKMEAATDRAGAVADRLDDSTTRADQASTEVLRRLEALQADPAPARAGRKKTTT